MKSHSEQRRKHLLEWYDTHRRTMPWREEGSAYRTWVSEIMLQQTRVDTVIPYFERFMDAFPTVDALAEAPLDEVLVLWAGLGYYSRARNLHKCAGVVVREYDGVFPETAAELMKLPGIGRYTAGAIASIAFGEAAPLVDGNVIRVFSRWENLEADVSETTTKKELWALAESWVPQERPGDYNQALMELGALVCTPKNPGCRECAVGQFCSALEAGTVLQRPVKKRRTSVREETVNALFLEAPSGKVLVARRKPEGLFGGLWELPQRWGAHEGGRTGIERWFEETFGFSCHLKGAPVPVQHILSHRRLKIAVYSGVCEKEDVPQVEDPYDAIQWASREDFESRGIGTVTRKMLRARSGQQELDWEEG